jgi:O-antigen ligase
MTAVPAPLPRTASSLTGRFLTLLAAATGAALLGIIAAGLVLALDDSALSLKLALAGGIGLVGFVALTVVRYDTAVAIAFGLTAVVFVEPAPCDGAFIVILAVSAVTGRFRPSRVPRSVQLFVGLLLAINVLSMTDAVSVGAALRFFFITGYLALFALWLCGYVDGPERARMLVVVWLFVGIISALLGIAAMNVGIPFKDHLLGDGGTRAQALFKDPNVYGPFLVPIAVILLEQRVRPRLLHLRGSTSAALFAILALGILFSYSRAAWMNLALSTSVMLVASAISRRGGRRALRTLMSLVLVGCVVAGALGATGSVGFLQKRAQLQSYETERFAAQHAGYEMGWSHPVGVGPGQFRFHHQVESHSTYVRVLAEQGFFGLAVWLAILLTTLVLALRSTILGWDTFGIGAPALLGCWCGLIFNSIVVDTLHWRHLWVVAALIWAGAARGMREERAAPAIV